MISTAIILAGGKSVRFSGHEPEHKALGRIGSHPILWHILSYLADSGLSRAIICTGYSGDQIAHYLDSLPEETKPPIHTKVLDTGKNSSTAARLMEASKFASGENILLTYCDILSDLDIPGFIQHHVENRAAVTVAAVNPPEAYGRIEFDHDGKLTRFTEKEAREDEWINGGYFIVSPQAIETISDPEKSWERGTVTELALKGELAGYRHRGFWMAMETQKERQKLDELFRQGIAPWLRQKLKRKQG
jgi:glucose-1-phosphate cytidylyltransferase